MLVATLTRSEAEVLNILSIKTKSKSKTRQRSRSKTLNSFEREGHDSQNSSKQPENQ